QTFRKVREPHVTVVVIDNDADESARSTVERAAVRARWPLCYGVEPRRGISYARNCGVTAVARECDFVVFVDDDELPRRNWPDEAVVDERVPKTRLTVRWLLQRAYRGGNGFARCELDVRPGARVRVVRGLKGAARVAQGVALLALAPAYGIGGLVEASSRVCLGLGMLTGVLGYGYDEYRQVHGACGWRRAHARRWK